MPKGTAERVATSACDEACFGALAAYPCRFHRHGPAPIGTALRIARHRLPTSSTRSRRPNLHRRSAAFSRFVRTAGDLAASTRSRAAARSAFAASHSASHGRITTGSTSSMILSRSVIVRAELRAFTWVEPALTLNCRQRKLPFRRVPELHGDSSQAAIRRQNIPGASRVCPFERCWPCRPSNLESLRDPFFPSPLRFALSGYFACCAFVVLSSPLDCSRNCPSTIRS